MFLEVVYVLRMIGWIKDFFLKWMWTQRSLDTVTWDEAAAKCRNLSAAQSNKCHMCSMCMWGTFFFLPWWGSKVTGIQGHQNEYLELGNSFIWIQQYCKATELVLYLRKKYSCDENKHSWLGCFDLQVIEIDRAGLISRFYSCFKFN